MGLGLLAAPGVGTLYIEPGAPWENAYSETFISRLRDELLDREVFANLKEAEVLEHKMGLRPGRPEIRLERERLRNGSVLVHNYGHGGAGVTLSWGCAEEACRLLLEREE